MIDKTPSERILVAARAVAERFNAEHGGQFLTAAPIRSTLTWDEFKTWAETYTGPEGWFLVGDIYRLMYGTEPDHGQAVRLGRALKSLPAERRRKVGPTHIYRLDAKRTARAD